MEVKKSSRNNPEETKVISSDDGPVSEEKYDDSRAEEENRASNGEVIIDITGRSGNESGISSNEEKMCRICHFGSEPPLIELGCDCRGELGLSHRHCAEAWFELKRNRLCEICGKTAKNVVMIGENRDEASIFMMEWNEMRLAAATLEGSDEGSRRCKKSLCNLLMGCLVLAFFAALVPSSNRYIVVVLLFLDEDRN